jgi:hypothetical protein
LPGKIVKEPMRLKKSSEDWRSGGDVSQIGKQQEYKETRRRRYIRGKEGKPPTVSEDGTEDSSHDWSMGKN